MNRPLDHRPMAMEPRQERAARAHMIGKALIFRLIEEQIQQTGCTDGSPTIQGIISAALSIMLLDPSKDDAAIAADISTMVATLLPQLRLASRSLHAEGAA